MPAHRDIALTNDTWTLLTDADVSAVRVQNKGRQLVLLQATAGDTAPTSADGCIRLAAYEIVLNEDLAALFPGVANAARLWGRATQRGVAELSVSHA